MPLTLALVVAAGVGFAQEPPSELAESAAATLAVKTVARPVPPEVVFEIRELSMASPDWRGTMQPWLNPVAREEAVAAWAVGEDGLRRLLEVCQADPRSAIVQAPKMTAPLGEPVRMTNEETVHYVAQLKRISDGPPGEGTNLAFQPETAEVHDGVRVVLTETRLKGPALYAHVAVQSNTVLGMMTTTYKESVGPEPDDPEVVRASFLAKLKSDAPHRAALNATIQVPEVASRRIEGDWLVPSNGALVFSMGPDSHAAIDRKPKPGEKAGGLGRAFGGKSSKRGYAERVICITALVKNAPAESAPAKSTP